MYAANFKRSGFDDLEAVAAMDDGDIQDLGVLPGHTEVLRREIMKLRRFAGESDDDAGNAVAAFLHEAGLEQYIGALLDQGFDDMESLLLVEEDDLRACGLLRGHAAKLRKRLREYELGGGDEQEAARGWAGPRPEQHHVAEPDLVVPRARQHALDIKAARNPAPPRAAPPAGGSVGGGALCAERLTVVERSWQKVLAVGPAVLGGRLYRHAFRLAPEAMELFPPEVRCKYRDWTLDEDESEDSDIFASTAMRNLFGKVVNAVGSTVAGLRDLGKLVPMLERLGARHVAYGLSEDHWPILGRALDMTLRDFLGEEYTSDVQANWTMVYNFMSAVMIEGFRQATGERAQRVAVAPEKAACPPQIPSEDSTAESSSSE